jgi:hypothetical protein
MVLPAASWPRWRAGLQPTSFLKRLPGSLRLAWRAWGRYSRGIMVQIYFLLVLFNVVSGLVLARGGLKRSLGLWDPWFQPFENRLVKGLLGVLTFLTGFLALIFVLPGDQIFLGDLFPSVTALLGGTVLVLEYYRKEEAPSPARIEDFLVSNKIVVGVLCLTFGVIHFFSPAVVFL